ncbi:MAG: MFS transporter [Pseudomonadales bacterium]|nr:MFS transporter [Pseudomonadales bacterium]MCP5182390.1 MFS transporter [Pseudomonadales bacterium]
MTATLVRIGTLLLAVAILLAGHGLQLTLLPMHAQALGWSTGSIGVTASAYFLGFVVGCLTVPALVARVGHIRLFMVMAAVATLALLGAGLVGQFGAWLVLRFATGYAFSGLYMVIESWLSEVADSASRGSVLAVYSVISLLAMVAGQAFLGLAEVGTLELFVLGAVLLCLAIIPVGLTRIAAPHPLPSLRFHPRALLEASRVALVCAFLGGLITGSVWAVGPLVGRQFGLDGADIGLLMSTAILGGALAQFPTGRYSDRTDRRRVIAALAVTGALVATAAWFTVDGSGLMLHTAMFLVGACSMPVYALCIATASDNATAPLIQIAGSVLIMNSLGSIVGPLVVAPLMAWQGGAAFFLYVAVCFALAAVWTLLRMLTVDRPTVHEQPFEPLPRTTPVVVELSQESTTGE